MLKKIFIFSALLSLTFLFSNTTFASAPTSGLVGYWNFDEGSGTTAGDSSGNSRNGTLTNGPTWTAGRVGSGAVQFDGVNDAINVGSGSTFNMTSVSISAWVKDTRSSWSSGNYQNIFVRGPSGSSAGNESYGLLMRSNGTNAQFFEMRISDGSTLNTADSGTGASNSNRWVHVVGTYTGGTTKLYIDGALVATATGGGSINNTPTDGTTAAIGGDIVEGRNYWNGLIDDVRIYNRALLASEILDVYNDTGSGPTPPPVPPPPPPPSDITAPVISSITTTSITTTGTTISWTTNELSDTQIEYGLTTFYGSQTSLNPTLLLSHTSNLVSLSPNTTYHYRVRSTDASSNTGVSGDQTFTTSAVVTPPPPPSSGATYYIDFAAGSDSNSGISTGAPWKHAPGDDSAVGNANRILQPGDTVVFKGGVVYQGTATVSGARRVVAPNNSGSVGNPITFISGSRHSSNWGTGQAIIDGGGPGAGAAKTGIYILNRAWITIDGLEIKNIGAPTADAAGVEFERGGGTPGVDNGIVRYAKIHNVNWSGSYIIGYGIENNHGANHLYEYNEVYNATDKLIETWGGGAQTQGSDNAGNAIIRYNVLHNAAVHCITITSDNAQVYNNIIWQCNDGVIANSPNPGYILKVDQGYNNKIWNNIAYDVSSGYGVLCGGGNEFYNNVIYGVGNNGSGQHGGNDEAGLAFYNNGSGGWTSPCVNNNKFFNNIVYYIPGGGSTGSPKMLYHNADGGSNNQVKNNVFYIVNGDSASIANRIRVNSACCNNSGMNSYYSVSSWESQFNTLYGGSGNIASGNQVIDPGFVGGTLGSLLNKPTGFLSNLSDVNANGFHLTPASPARILGQILSSPFSIDLIGMIRTSFTPGVYEESNTSPSPSPVTPPVVPPPSPLTPPTPSGGAGVGTPTSLSTPPPSSQIISPISSLVSPSTPGITLTRTLSLGTKGVDVTQLQTFLISQNYLISGSATGYYGSLTRTAVQKYQCATIKICTGDESTTGYGLVGKLTRQSLNSQSTGGGTTGTTTNGLTAAQRAVIQAQINQLLVLVQQLILRLKASRGL